MYPCHLAGHCHIFICSNMFKMYLLGSSLESLWTYGVLQNSKHSCQSAVCVLEHGLSPSGQAGNIQTHVFVSCLVSRGRYSAVRSSLLCPTTLDVVSHASESAEGYWFSSFPVGALVGGVWRVSALGEEVQTFHPTDTRHLKNLLLLFLSSLHPPCQEDVFFFCYWKNNVLFFFFILRKTKRGSKVVLNSSCLIWLCLIFKFD